MTLSTTTKPKLASPAPQFSEMHRELGLELGSIPSHVPLDESVAQFRRSFTLHRARAAGVPAQMSERVSLVSIEAPKPTDRTLQLGNRLPPQHPQSGCTQVWFRFRGAALSMPGTSKVESEVYPMCPYSSTRGTRDDTMVLCTLKLLCWSPASCSGWPFGKRPSASQALGSSVPEGGDNRS